ncbi:hypothetical protein PRI8871_01869 [Pseudoprimorskyibacter insulae]|uniref:Flagellar protein FliT n=1 Tax=Pseudoprimorskyibacter insulae TaxID=1695997 RepID=A0A2R8AVW1_9RHOB|nr:hypothetical protein PRI8871_01869 [Pseudoprimorskyibacter insulae]
MSLCIALMSEAAATERLERLCQELARAVDEGRLEDVSRLDHAIRNAVIALIGEDQFGDAPQDRVEALQRALVSVRNAAAVLQKTQEAVQKTQRKRGVYLAYSKGKGKGKG